MKSVSSLKRKKFDTHILGLIIFIIVLSVIMTFLSSNFLTARNLINVFQQSVFVMLIGFGMTFVLTTGGIDLSVGVVMALSGGMMAWLIPKGVPTVAAIVIGIVLGAGIGMGNGLLICKLKIPPFIATLATMTIGRGIIYIWTNSIPFRSYTGPIIKFLGKGRIFNIQFTIFVAVAAIIILQIVYRKTRFGRYVTAYGSNFEAIRNAGVKTDRLQISVYALSGLMAGIAGILLACKLETVHPAMGSGYELQGIAAAIIGGTSLTGGRGTIIGSIFGAFILYLISNCLNILNVNTNWETIIQGLIILIIVSLEFFTRKRR